MEIHDVTLLLAVAGIVFVPLAREYADFRANRFSRGAALATVSLVFPALAVGVALSLPLASAPTAQWVATVVTTLALYSLATRAILARAASLETAPSRRI